MKQEHFLELRHKKVKDKKELFYPHLELLAIKCDDIYLFSIMLYF